MTDTPEDFRTDDAPDSAPTSETPAIVIPDIRPALEPVCCGSGCPGCPYY